MSVYVKLNHSIVNVELFHAGHIIKASDIIEKIGCIQRTAYRILYQT